MVLLVRRAHMMKNAVDNSSPVTYFVDISGVRVGCTVQIRSESFVEGLGRAAVRELPFLFLAN